MAIGAAVPERRTLGTASLLFACCSTGAANSVDQPRTTGAKANLRGLDSATQFKTSMRIGIA